MEWGVCDSMTMERQWHYVRHFAMTAPHIEHIPIPSLTNVS